MRILLVAYGGGHVAALVPLVAQARAAGHEVMFLALTTAREYLRQCEIPFLSAQDLWPYAAPDAREYGEQMAAKTQPHPQVPHAESVAYLGICFADLVETYGLEEAQQRYQAKGRAAFLPVATLTRAFAAWQPDLVVTTSAPRVERAAIEAAGKCHIPSICIADLFAIQEIEWMKHPDYATRICVLNEAVRQRIVSHGRPPEDVIVTGNPAFDRLFAPEFKAQGKAMRAARGWEDGRITLLYGSQVEAAEYHGLVGDVTLPARIEEVLRQLVAADDRFRLIVRYHPSEKRIFVPAKHVEFSPASESVSAALYAVDAVVTMTSTIGLEAHIIGLPVLTVDCSVFVMDAPLAQMGISTGVSQPEDLPAALRAMADRWIACTSETTASYTAANATQAVWSVLQAALANAES